MLGFICIINRSVIDSQEKSTLIFLLKDSGTSDVGSTGIVLEIGEVRSISPDVLLKNKAKSGMAAGYFHFDIFGVVSERSQGNIEVRSCNFSGIVEVIERTLLHTLEMQDIGWEASPEEKDQKSFHQTCNGMQF
jgi:hypothetical protein